MPRFAFLALRIDPSSVDSHFCTWCFKLVGGFGSFKDGKKGFTLKFPYQIRFSWSSMLHESMLYAFLMDQRTKYFFFNYDYSQLIKENSFYPCKTI